MAISLSVIFSLYIYLVLLDFGLPVWYNLGMKERNEEMKTYLITAQKDGKSLSNYITYDLEDAFRYFRENTRLGWHCELKEI